MEKTTPPQTGNQTRTAGEATALVLLAGAVFLAWSNSFGVPFLLDDFGNIVKSPSIRQLWPPWEALFPPPGSAVGGRPLFNLSFALNYAVSGLEVWSFHLFNVLVHALAAWALFGLVRRSLLLPGMVERYGRRAGVLAFFTALMWAVHPLHTDAVTYISQRAEAMMGLFFLASAWLALRGWTSPRPRGWHALSVLAFVAGVGVKEVMVALPMVMLACEWVFFHRSPVRAVRNSPVLYTGYGVGLGLLGFLVASGATRSVTPEATATPLSYLASQAQVIVHYLSTTFWPAGLAFEYAWPVIGYEEAAPYALFVAGLLGVSAWLLARRNPMGFLGAWFFLILGPTSSIMPLPFLAWDRRMYLPLAAVAALVILGGYRLGARIAARWPRARGLAVAGGGLAVAAALVLGTATWVRNLDYATEVSIWQDTVEKRPGSAIAWESLCVALEKEGRFPEAETAARKALVLKPEKKEVWISLAGALKGQGREDESLSALQKALELDPDDYLARYNLAVQYQEMGDLEKALEESRFVHENHPGFRPGSLQYALALAMTGQLDLAEDLLRELDRKSPGPEGSYTLARVLEMKGNLAEAVSLYEMTLKARPGHLEARFGLAGILARHGRIREAEAQYAELVRMVPEEVDARLGHGWALVLLGRPGEAEARFREALFLDPGSVEAARGLEALSKGTPSP